MSVKANLILCAQCDNLIHGGCAGVKIVTSHLRENLLAGNVKGIFERQWSMNKSYVMKCRQ